ncbi:MAG: retropepsin-like aspartic protease [Cyanobacteria bacterium P01_F01_bin.42]
MSSARLHRRVPLLGFILGVTMGLSPLPPALGQSGGIGSLNQSLQQAVATQKWDTAIDIIDRLIIAAPEQRQSLEKYRTQLATLKAKESPKAYTATPKRTKGLVSIKRREHGVVIIDTIFNDRKQFEMLLDSGASVTVITRQMAQSLGIRREHVVQTATFSTANGKTEMPIVYISSMTVGGLVARDVPVAIAGPDMDIGLLGQDFLQRYDVTIKRDSVEFKRR